LIPVLNQRLRARLQVAKLLSSKGVATGKMRRAGVLLALLLSLSALSASAAEAHKVSTALQEHPVHGISRLQVQLGTNILSASSDFFRRK